MEITGNFQAPAASPLGNKPSVSIEVKAEYTPEWIQW
jgi:hypothetical protein